MKIRESLRICLLVNLLCMAGIGSAQTVQVAKAELNKDASNQDICLVDDTHVNHVDVFDDEMIMKRLPANQSGYVEFSVNDFFTSHVVVRLQEENNASVNYTIEFVNTSVIFDGSVTHFFQNDDVFRISRCGGEINFYHDDNLVVLPNPIISGNFDQPLVAVVEVLDANAGADICISFPHLVPHCVPDSQDPMSTEGFIAAKKYLDGAVSRIENDEIKFWYKERYAIANGVNNAVSYKVYDWEKTEFTSGSLVNCYGPNWHKIDLTGLATGQYYTLEISGPNKGETYYIRFEN